MISNKSAEPRFFFIVLFYGTTHVKSCLQEVHRCFGHRIERDQANLLLIQNASGLPEQGFLQGDNRFQEFSGWQKGVDFLQERGLGDGDIVAFINDSFHRNYDSSVWRSRFDSVLRRLSLGGGLFGWRNRLPAAVKFLGFSGLPYIRTNCMFTTWQTLKRIGGVLPATYDLDAITAEYPQLLSANQEGFQNYSEYVTSWLTGSVSETSGHGWYRAEAVTQDSYQVLRQKATSIYLEHFLSARVLRENMRIFALQDQFAFRLREFGYRVLRKIIRVPRPGRSLWRS